MGKTAVSALFSVSFRRLGHEKEDGSWIKRRARSHEARETRRLVDQAKSSYSRGAREKTARGSSEELVLTRREREDGSWIKRRARTHEARERRRLVDQAKSSHSRGAREKTARGSSEELVVTRREKEGS